MIRTCTLLSYSHLVCYSIKINGFYISSFLLLTYLLHLLGILSSILEVLVPDEVERFQKIFTIPCTCTCTFQVFHLPSTTLMGANV